VIGRMTWIGLTTERAVASVCENTTIVRSSPEGTLLLSNLHPGLRPMSANLFWMFLVKTHHKTVILSGALLRSIA
jgi:hypothetical protein